MRRMSKGLRVFLAVIVSVGLLASCGKSATSDKIELRLSWWGGDSRHQATLNAIEKFQEKYPEISVIGEYTGYEGHQEKLTTQIAGKTAPDVMQLNWNWLVTFSKDGQGLYDLSELSDDLDLTTIDSELLEYGKMNGVLNAVPVSMTGRALHLNKTTYDKFNQQLPTTWDEVFALEGKFEEGYYPFDLDPYSAFLMTNTYIQQKTGKAYITEDGKLNYSKEDLIAGFDFYQSLVDKKIVPNIPLRSGEGGNAVLYEMPAYLNGQYAGVYEWSSSASKYADPLKETDQELVLANLPTMKNQKASGVILKPSMLWGVSKDTAHPKEAALLLDFLLNDEAAAAELGLERGIPLSTKSYEVLEKEGKLEGLEVDGTKFVLDSANVASSPYFEDASLQEIYKAVFEEFGYGKLDSEAAAEKFISQVDERLAEIA